MKVAPESLVSEAQFWFWNTWPAHPPTHKQTGLRMAWTLGTGVRLPHLFKEVCCTSPLV